MLKSKKEKYFIDGVEVEKDLFLMETKDYFKWWFGRDIHAASSWKAFEETEKNLYKNFNDMAIGWADNVLMGNKIYNSIMSDEVNVQSKEGKKESQTIKKAPVYTYCRQFKNAIEALSFRSLYGHEKYEKGDDWENFSRVKDADFEYSNAMFRHALDIGEEETEQHYIAAAWDAIARLEIYLRNNKNK